MSNRTREINRITTAIIRISIKLMILALIILCLYEAVMRGYAFGHEIFYAESAEPAPGRDVTFVITENESLSEAAVRLREKGLIKNEFPFLFQSRFYDYDEIYQGTYELNTSMTSRDILQKLSEKPESEEKAAQAGKQKAKTAASERTKTSAVQETKAQGAEETAQDTPAAASEIWEGQEGEELPGTEYSQELYPGEEMEQDMEGDWIEEVSEDEE